MDLSSVTSLGVIAFLCFKFAGYLLLFVFLKREQPAVQAGALFMAGARAALGILAGGMLYLGWDAARHRVSGFYNFSYEVWPYYSVLFVLRILVWAATIYIFLEKCWPAPKQGSAIRVAWLPFVKPDGYPRGSSQYVYSGRGSFLLDAFAVALEPATARVKV
jgi:hypothetical protein